MKSWFRKTTFVLATGLSALSCFAYYEYYFRWRSCFNEFGRCFDSENSVVYFEQSGVAWLSLAVIASGIALYQLWRLIR